MSRACREIYTQALLMAIAFSLVYASHFFNASFSSFSRPYRHRSGHAILYLETMFRATWFSHYSCFSAPFSSFSISPHWAFIFITFLQRRFHWFSLTACIEPFHFIFSISSLFSNRVIEAFSCHASETDIFIYAALRQASVRLLSSSLQYTECTRQLHFITEAAITASGFNISQPSE
jgi:hypothetical protein